ncbi:signal peptidase II [bacterium]|nr:signal peptidase II [bacterium]
MTESHNASSAIYQKAFVIYFGALGVFALDQLTKFWVSHVLRVDASYLVLPDIFAFTHKLNPGAAFGLFRGKPLPFFLTISTLALVFIMYFVVRVEPERKRLVLAMSFILGGAAGNIADRLRIGAVVDFLDFRIGGYVWPTFNVADVGIVVGVGIFLWDMAKHEMAITAEEAARRRHARDAANETRVAPAEDSR